MSKLGKDHKAGRERERDKGGEITSDVLAEKDKQKVKFKPLRSFLIFNHPSYLPRYYSVAQILGMLEKFMSTPCVVRLPGFSELTLRPPSSRLLNNNSPPRPRNRLLLRPIEKRSLNIRHDILRQIRQFDRRTIDGDDGAMGLIQRLNLRMLVIMLEPIHARWGKIGHDDASVGREGDGLDRIEAVGGAVFEGREVLSLGEAGVGDHGWGVGGSDDFAGAPEAETGARAEDGGARTGDGEGGDDGCGAWLQHGDEGYG